MASRMKEDERNEKIIRGLVKLQTNKRCINCNNLGPQYVCTSFWTFVCTNCSGLHREFCHRVKSISMAKFTTQEVNALQEGGNERAKEIYFKDWDPQCHSFPDSSNIDRLRDFIKHVYVERRFSGGRNMDRPLQGKAGQDDSNQNRRGDSYRTGSRSPSYDDRYNERVGTAGRNGDRNIRYIYGEISPGHDSKRSPRRFEVVDDRVRDDKYGTGNQISRFEDQRLPPKPEGSSPMHQKNESSPPMVRPVRDILGDGMPQLNVGDTPELNNTQVAETSACTQRISSLSRTASGDENTVEEKKVKLGSLIDFTADLEPPVVTAPQQSTVQQNTSPPSDSGNWAFFDNAGQQTASQSAANPGPLESALNQLSATGPEQTSSMSTLPNSGVVTSPNANGGKHPTVQQHKMSLLPSYLGQPSNLPFNAPVAGGQSWGSTGVPSMQGTLPNSGGHSSQVASIPPHEINAGVSSQPPSMEAKPTGRKELPADLFAALYPPAPVSVPGWQRGLYPVTGYMQYPMGMPQPMPAFPYPSKSTNPFDSSSVPTLAHATTFPSMASLHGALPHVPAPSPLARSSSFGSPSPQWVPQQQSSFPSAMPQGQYMMQQVPGNMPQMMHSDMAVMGHQGTGGASYSAAALGNLGINQLPTGSYSLPNTPNSFSSTNPFG